MKTAASSIALLALASSSMLALMLPAPASAAQQPLRHNPVQGGIALLNLGASESAPRVYYGRSRVLVYRESDGRWVGIIGIPLKAATGRALLKVNGSPAAFRIAPGEYGESHIEITERSFVEPPDAQLHQRIVNEQQQLNSIRSVWKPGQPPAQILLPAKGQISTPFGYRRYINGQLSSTHRGLDIAAASGTPVISPTAGRVSMAQNLFYTGLTIVIDHGMGLHTLYAHLSEITTAEGAEVAAGDLIGKVGATGRSTGPHLHWGLTLNGTSVDPALLLGEEQLQALRQPPVDGEAENLP